MVEVVNPPEAVAFELPEDAVTLKLSAAEAEVTPRIDAKSAKTRATADDFLNMTLPEGGF